MDSKIGHIYLYVSSLNKSYLFYKDLLELLGYKESLKADWGVSFDKDGTSIWLEQAPEDGKKQKYTRRAPGLNHLAFKLSSKEAVDKFFENFIKQKGIPTLYGTPKAFPDYGDDYYAVFFEDPDKIKLEVAFYS